MTKFPTFGAFPGFILAYFASIHLAKSIQDKELKPFEGS
jgi:hypothetical protein